MLSHGTEQLGIGLVRLDRRIQDGKSGPDANLGVLQRSERRVRRGTRQRNRASRTGGRDKETYQDRLSRDETRPGGHGWCRWASCGPSPWRLIQGRHEAGSISGGTQTRRPSWAGGATPAITATRRGVPSCPGMLGPYETLQVSREGSAPSCTTQLGLMSFIVAGVGTSLRAVFPCLSGRLMD